VGPVARAALAVAAGAVRPEDRLASRGGGPREREDVLADPGGVLQSNADRANLSRNGGGRRAFLDRLAQDGELALEIGAQPFTLVSCVPQQQACLLELRVNGWRSEEHTSELQSRFDLVCRLLLEKKKTHNDYQD